MQRDLDMVPSLEGEHKKSYSGKKVKRVIVFFLSCKDKDIMRERIRVRSTLPGAAGISGQMYTFEGDMTYVHTSHVDTCFFKYKTTGSVTAVGCLALQKIWQLILLLNRDF